ncbi:DUF423 domain-containing protein [Oceanospirillum sp.]|uniref:DUF423 domain-containing protein n=1 Tax=Oceanospirillum sp. TaxID=2021254 RepID=UPI003A9060EC
MQNPVETPKKALFYFYGLLWLLAGLLGASSVFLDAWLSHGFSSTDPDILNSLQTAVRYQQFNSLTLAVSLWMAGSTLRKGEGLRKRALIPALLFLAAILAFCGGIYGKHLLGFATGAITPTGGFLMALGWLSLAHYGFYQHKR